MNGEFYMSIILNNLLNINVSLIREFLSKDIPYKIHKHQSLPLLFNYITYHLTRHLVLADILRKRKYKTQKENKSRWIFILRLEAC